jgi:hypothetical protein
MGFQFPQINFFQPAVPMRIDHLHRPVPRHHEPGAEYFMPADYLGK